MKTKFQKNSSMSKPEEVPAETPEVTPAVTEEPVDPTEAELDRVVKEQQALLDARNKKEAEEKEVSLDEMFIFTALINFKKYVKVTAGSEKDALDNIFKMPIGDFITSKDVRFDKKQAG